MLCHITGTLYKPDGTAYAGAFVNITSVPTSIESAYLGSVVPRILTVRTDANGNVDFNLLTGEYIVTTNNKRGEGGFVNFTRFNVPELPAAQFSDCIDAAEPVIIPAWLEQAITARDEAEAARDASEAAAAEVEIIVADLIDDFETRADFVAWVGAGNVPSVGAVVNAGGYAYRYVGGTTTLPGLSGWVPNGDTYADHFKQNGGGVDMTPAFVAASEYLAGVGGGAIRLKTAIYDVADTTVIPAGISLQGEGKNDMWGESVGLGTVIRAVGPGIKRRWRDVDGSDVADENPMFVAGGNCVYFRDVTFDCPSGAGAWTRAVMYPCVKQCGFERIQTTNRFSRRSILLDLTWSNRNTTLMDLHPTVKTSAGMNEFWGVNSWLVGGLEVGGTTRNPADYTSENWIWGWAGGSDLHFSGIRGGGLRVDAAVKNHMGTVQGVWFHDCAWRVDTKFPAISLDRANRVVFVSGYGEATGSGGTARLELTSRSNNVSFISGRYNGFDIWYNGVNTGITMEDGNAGIDGLTIISEHGRTYIGDYEIRPDRFNPRVASSRDIGTASLPFGSVFATKLESATGGSIGIRANGESVAEAFSAGFLLDKVIRPRVDGAVGLGTAAYRFSAARVNNAFISDYLAVGGQDANAPRVYGGSGAPTSTAPNGSMYMRTDGAAGSTLYCRIAGAWVAVA